MTVGSGSHFCWGELSAPASHLFTSHGVCQGIKASDILPSGRKGCMGFLWGSVCLPPSSSTTWKQEGVDWYCWSLIPWSSLFSKLLFHLCGSQGPLERRWSCPCRPRQGRKDFRERTLFTSSLSSAVSSPGREDITDLVGGFTTQMWKQYWAWLVSSCCNLPG